GFTPERQRSCRHFVEHSAEREQVGTGIEFFSPYLLRGHVGNGAKCRTGTGKVLLRVDGRVADSNAVRLEGYLCQPEIENLRLPSICHEDVRWLDVPVDDPFRMCGVKRVGNLNAEIEHSVN